MINGHGGPALTDAQAEAQAQHVLGWMYDRSLDGGAFSMETHVTFALDIGNAWLRDQGLLTEATR